MKTKLVILFFMAMGGLAATSAQGQAPGKGYDLYLLVGQSSMAGRGEIQAADTITDERVIALGREDRWVPAREPLHYDKRNRGTGPGLAFGKMMANSAPGVKIGLIPAAVGGTKISYWEPGNERGLYKEAIRKAKAAMAAGILKGIIWQQGESDSNAKDAAVYKEELLKLLTAFRRDLGNENLPVVVGGLGNFLRSPYHTKVNQALQEAAKELKNVKFSAASNLGHIGDSLHFNADAQHENGNNMARAMLSLQQAVAKNSGAAVLQR